MTGIRIRSLRDCLQDLNEFPEGAKPELGVEIIVAATKVTWREASHWIELFGNPLLDPIASTLFSLTMELNPDVIRETCLVSQGDDEPIDEVLLATSMTRLILEALIVFPRLADVRH
jgi:hypothetical protein